MFKLAYRVEAELLGLDNFPPLNRTSDEISSSINRFFGAIIDSRLVGVVELEYTARDSEKNTTLASLAVDPDCFRSGVGKALVMFVIKTTDGGLTVSTGEDNIPAIRLYRKMGFEDSGSVLTSDDVRVASFKFSAR